MQRGPTPKVKQMTGIKLTQSAATRIRSFLERDGGAAFRLGVRKTGCSGWAYTVDLVDEVSAGDQVFEDQGIRIIVDAEALELIDGTEVDFVSEGLNRTFRFTNPNITGECGCGESFAVTA